MRSNEWWSLVLREAEGHYARWQQADPIQRTMVQQPRFQRLESRTVSMLLKAIPATVKEEIVHARSFTTVSILFKIYCLYQPGGLKERNMLLTFLSRPGAAQSNTDAVLRLRRWFRGVSRTQQVGASLPDVSILVAALDEITSSLLANAPLLQFRMNLVRHQCSVDHTPTLTSVLSFGKSLQAEFEMASIGGDQGNPQKRPRNQRMDAGGGRNPESKSASEPNSRFE